MYANQCQIDFTAETMQITREPVASNTPEIITRSQVVGVYPVKINSKPPAPDDVNWKYRFDDMIIIRIATSNDSAPDGHDLEFDIQEVTNQAGWTHDLAGQQQCVSDIRDWLDGSAS